MTRIPCGRLRHVTVELIVDNVGSKRALAPSSRPTAMAASPYTTCYRRVQRPPSRIDMATLAGGEGWRMVEQQAC
jgi:hypothetical protein